MLFTDQRMGRTEHGTSLVEFALVLPILLLVLLGVIDFGLYFYNDLQLTHVARDAARYASVGRGADAAATVTNAVLVSTDVNAPVITLASSGQEASVVLTGTYHTLTPLPAVMTALFGEGMGGDLPINATARMRRE